MIIFLLTFGNSSWADEQQLIFGIDRKSSELFGQVCGWPFDHQRIEKVDFLSGTQKASQVTSFRINKLCFLVSVAIFRDICPQRAPMQYSDFAWQNRDLYTYMD